MKTNIVLIGLMGVGKTTLGKRLAETLGMEFIDADDVIEKHYGNIPSLFAIGEKQFRDAEEKVVESISAQDNQVISTGGGVVLRKTNMEALARKGVIFYLKRPVEEILHSIETSYRPLLKNGADVLYRLEKEREPLYISYCDHVIDASNLEQALKAIVSRWMKKES